ncbi:MAG: elongation factor P [Candidatus Magasanikbacteria bacterium]|nr:elongation factor P [Candidatus Magasanikbacteria bacterium]
MASVTEIKKGSVIKRNGDLFVVTISNHISPGKGTPFTRCKMKSLTTAKVIEETLKDNEVVDIVEVGYNNMQYLYNDGTFYTFMDNNTYEQVQLDADTIGDDAKYLKDGLEVVMCMYNEQPVAVELPRKISYKVTEAPPAVKGDTASGNVQKEIILENGLKAMAPIFIKEGERVIINTDTGLYVERDNT